MTEKIASLTLDGVGRKFLADMHLIFLPLWMPPVILMKTLSLIMFQTLTNQVLNAIVSRTLCDNEKRSQFIECSAVVANNLLKNE